MSQATAMLCVGAKVAFDGELFEVVGLDGRQATIRTQQGQYQTATIAWLASQATVLAVDAQVVGSVAALGPALGALSAEEQATLAERAAHIREVLTGYRASSGALARPGEPRPEYAPTLSLEARYQAKATELGVGLRTLKRWVAGYRQAGEAAWSTPAGSPDVARRSILAGSRRAGWWSPSTWAPPRRQWVRCWRGSTRGWRRPMARGGALTVPGDGLPASGAADQGHRCGQWAGQGAPVDRRAAQGRLWAAAGDAARRVRNQPQGPTDSQDDHSTGNQKPTTADSGGTIRPGPSDKER